MGTGVRGKYGSLDRSSQPPDSHSDVADKSSCNDSESSSNSKGFRFGDNESVDKRHLNPSFDVSLLDYYTDEQLKEFLLTKIELLHNEVITKFVAMGHNERIVIEALLRNGHCHGNMDLLTNIMHNTQLYLSTGASGCEDRLVNSKKVFANLMQLREASLFSLVCCLRQSNPCLSRRDAMCWFLRSDLRVVHGSSMKLSNAPNSNSDSVSTQRDNEHPIGSELTPSMIVLLKDNADFLAAECRRLEQSNQDSSSSAVEKDSTVSLDVVSAMNQKGIKLILEKFHDMNLEKDSESVPKDQKHDMLLSLVNEIKDLDVQVKERKKWADEKAVQAARRLCNERNELKKLRKERDEDQEQIKQQKSTLDVDHPTVKSLIDVEITLRQANMQADRAILIVARLEAEKMKLKAEIEASKLTTSESLSKSFEAAKNEKKHMKKIVACEKQRGKLEEEIAYEKQKLINLQQETVQLEAAKRSAEARWREEQESKEHAVARVKQERRLKKETETNNKQIQESLRANIDLELKRHKDEIQRLEQVLARVKSLTDPDHDLTSLFGPHFEGDDTIGRLLHGSGDEVDENDDEVEHEHECVMCEEDEAFVVFLPCGHQVVCGGCNEELLKNGGDECPACGVSIHQRIRVFCEGC